MNIALAHDHLYQIGGAELVLREMSDLYPDAPIYTLIHSSKNLSLFRDRIIKTSLIQDLPFGTSLFKWYLMYMPTAWEQMDFSKYDVVISSSSAFVKGIITSPRTTHICYCHTPTRYLWSDSIEYIDSLHIPYLAKLYLMQHINRLRAWDQLAASRVDHFIANSYYIARRIKKYYHRDSTVIYPPVATDRFALSSTIGSHYLIVSRMRPYKRVDLAIEAFNNMKLPLVVIGGGEELTHLRSLAKPNITFLGEVSDTIRNRYLSTCRALIYPQEEDFGISAVEAMASGRPVIAYRAGGAMETVSEGITGTFFDEQTWESLAYAVMKFDHSTYDPVIIQRHAQQFDSSVFKSKIASLVSSLVQS